MAECVNYAGSTIADAFKQVQKTLKDRPIYGSWPDEDSEIQTRYEAETLLLCATGMTRTQFLTSPFNRLSEDEANWLQKAVFQRLHSMPLGYIVKKVSFYGRDFAVDPGCLIPRPETEILVEEAVRWTRRNKPNAYIYDLGCGSGAISISLALECKEAHVEAVDISEDALCIATNNAKNLGATVLFSLKDGLQDLSGRAMQFHVLVSNPPYIPSADVLTLESDVRDYEPHLALDGGADGLYFYRSIFAIGDKMFVPGAPAAFFMEVGIGQAEVLLHELLHEQSVGVYSGWSGWKFGIKKDFRNVSRVLYGERMN